MKLGFLMALAMLACAAVAQAQNSDESSLATMCNAGDTQACEEMVFDTARHLCIDEQNTSSCLVYLMQLQQQKKSFRDSDFRALFAMLCEVDGGTSCRSFGAGLLYENLEAVSLNLDCAVIGWRALRVAGDHPQEFHRMSNVRRGVLAGEPAKNAYRLVLHHVLEIFFQNTVYSAFDHTDPRQIQIFQGMLSQLAAIEGSRLKAIVEGLPENTPYIDFVDAVFGEEAIVSIVDQPCWGKFAPARRGCLQTLSHSTEATSRG